MGALDHLMRRIARRRWGLRPPTSQRTTNKKQNQANADNDDQDFQDSTHGIAAMAGWKI